MLFKLSSIVGFALFHSALAQVPQDIPLPRTSGANSARLAEVANDPASAYASRREAALAALQAGYNASTVDQNRGRAMWYLLVSLRRDPLIAKTLYDMGVLCAQDERWRDALAFYRAARQANPEPKLDQLAAAEIERIPAVELLESTPAGRKQRQFDIQLLAALRKSGDPSAALVEAGILVKKDKTRWEPLALEGLMHAKNGSFADSAKDLEDAARLAPPTQRQKLQSAANVARREANFAQQVMNADGLWEQRQWAPAAQKYSEAWQNSPDHLDVAMKAVTSFLMADQVGPAVELLARLRDARADEISAQATAMLKELGSISEDAKREAAQPRAPSTNKQLGEVAERITSLVGSLTTPQMELTARPNPPLVPDNTPFIPVHDEDLAGGRNYAGLLSTDSVYERYRTFLTEASAPPPAQPDPTPPAEAVPAAHPLALAPPELPSIQRRLPKPIPAPDSAAATPVPAAAVPAETGSSVPAGQPVPIESSPSGAIVVLDDNATVKCSTPCRMALSLGRHTLRATLPGYRDTLKIFSVEKKVATVAVTLDARTGVVFVQNPTPGAAIFLNGKKTDHRTPAQFALPEGEYEVGIQIAGEEVKTKKVAIRDGALLQVNF